MRRLSPTARLVLALAALLAALAAGAGIAGVGTQRAKPTPTPTPTLLSLPLGMDAGLIPDQPYLFPIGSRSVVGIVASVSREPVYPRESWHARWGTQDEFYLSGPPDLSLAFITPDDIYRDACHRLSGPMGVGTGLDAFIAGMRQSLANSPGVTVAEMGETPLLDGLTLGGRTVRALSISVAADANRIGCDLERVLPLHLPTDVGGVRADNAEGLYPGETMTLLIADIGGQIVVVESEETVLGCSDATHCGASPRSALRVQDERAVLASLGWTSPTSVLPPAAAPSLPQASLPRSVSGPPPLPGGWLRPGSSYEVSLGTAPTVDFELRPPEPVRWKFAADGSPSPIGSTSPYSQVLYTGRYMTLSFGAAIQIVGRVHTDSCAWNDAGAQVDPADITGLASALGKSLAKIPGADVSSPVESRVGNRSAIELTVTLDPSVPLEGCYQGIAIPWTVPDGPLTAGWSIRSGGVYEVYLLEANGAQVAVVAWSEVNHPEGADAVHALLDAITWR